MKPISFKSFPKKTTAVPDLHKTFCEGLMDDTVEMAEEILSKWISSEGGDKDQLDSSDALFSVAHRREAKRYVQAVTDVRVTMEYLISVNPRSEKLIRAQLLLQTAIRYLEKEFFRILMSIRESLDTESIFVHSSRHRSLARGKSVLDSYSNDDSDSSTRGESVSPCTGDGEVDAEVDIMADLRLISDCLISVGHTKNCSMIYAEARKSVVDDGLCYLGVEKLCFAQLQKMEPEVLDLKIKTWLRAVKIAVVKLFHGERILCDHVFSNSAAMNEYCFAEVTREAASDLFAFSESVGKFRETPELLFCTLDLYETIWILLPEIESIFCYDSTAAIRSPAAESLTRLGKSASLMIEEFESAVQKEPCKTTAADGGIHLLEKYKVCAAVA